jgi:hypothetical protein
MFEPPNWRVTSAGRPWRKMLDGSVSFSLVITSSSVSHRRGWQTSVMLDCEPRDRPLPLFYVLQARRSSRLALRSAGSWPDGLIGLGDHNGRAVIRADLMMLPTLRMQGLVKRGLRPGRRR